MYNVQFGLRITKCLNENCTWYMVNCTRSGAIDGTRTRDPRLGKPMLYQLSHYRIRIIFTFQVQR